VKTKSLQDLGAIGQKLAEQRRLAAAHEAARLEAQRKTHAEKTLFVRSVGQVKSIGDHKRVKLAPAPPPPVAVQQQLDEQRVLMEARKLRRGEWTLQREIDLHGLRREDAREALSTFIREAFRQGIRCVRVVHGKGLGSPGKTPVLKGRVHSWLIQKTEVLAFVQARGDEGGAGALVVLLKASGG
jgi:DNA-nicking Smr family endonuclease